MFLLICILQYYYRCNWTVSLDLPQGIDITFRYVVCCLIDTLDEDRNEAKKVVVRRWETSLRPRKIACHGNYTHFYLFTLHFCFLEMSNAIFFKAEKNMFIDENQNSEHTLFSLTFKVEENKMCSEFLFSLYKHPFWPF